MFRNFWAGPCNSKVPKAKKNNLIKKKKKKDLSTF